MCLREYSDARQRLLFKNVIYVGALAALLDIDFSVLKDLIADQFKGKEKLIAPNVHALELGHQYAVKNFDCPIGIRLERGGNIARHMSRDRPHPDGRQHRLRRWARSTAAPPWPPGTRSRPPPRWSTASTSTAGACASIAGTGEKNYAIVQAEDELSAIGMVIGAAWNGARSFTATSGPGLSLMSEFLGLAYFAEIPAVLIDVQRAGPSTGMPTRTQQSDVLAAAYASHGDTKHVLLFPATPAECFSLTVKAFDLADRLQTPVIMLTDLDLGMNDWMSDRRSSSTTSTPTIAARCSTARRWRT